MADASLQIGNGNWAVKTSLLLGYNIVSNRYNPIEIGVTRQTTGSRTNVAGIIDYKDNNIARINYEGGVGSLLLEPLRTNLVNYSNDFSNALWNKGNLTVTPNSIISPDGSLNGFLINVTSIIGENLYEQITVLASTTYTFSFYVKRGTSTQLKYSIYNTTIPSDIIAPTSYYSQTNSSTWTRVSVTFTTPIGCTSLRVYPIRDSITIGTSYFYGTQLEQGAYPTSYIPTTTAIVTRNADVCSKSGISDLIGQTEGVMFIESAALFNDLTARAVGISDGTSANRLSIIYSATSNTINITGNSYGVIFPNTISYTLTDETQFAKIAVRYKVNNITLWVNGVKRGIDITSQQLPQSFSRIGFDSGSGFSLFYGKTKQVQLYKTYLTDTEMTQLTTL